MVDCFAQCCKARKQSNGNLAIESRGFGRYPGLQWSHTYVRCYWLEMLSFGVFILRLWSRCEEARRSKLLNWGPKTLYLTIIFTKAGQTVLHYACRKGRLEIISRLLQQDGIAQIINHADKVGIFCYCRRSFISTSYSMDELPCIFQSIRNTINALWKCCWIMVLIQTL